MAALGPAVGAPLRVCEALKGQFAFAQAVIDSAEPVAAGALNQGAGGGHPCLPRR